MAEEQKVDYPGGEEAVLSAFQAILSACKQNRRPHDDISEKIAELVANEYDWSGKADWQSKIGLPTYASNVEKFAAIMQRGMNQAQTFFAVVSKPWGQYAAFAQSVHSWIDFRLERLKFKEKFAAACKVAGVYARMWFKPYYAARVRELLVWPRREIPVLDAEGMPLFDPLTGEPATTIQSEEPYWEPRVEMELTLDMLHPRHVWRDPTGRDRFVIHQYRVDYGELLKLAEEGHYNLAAVKQLEPHAKGDEEEEADRQAERDRNDEGDPGEDVDKSIVLHEYWGDLYDEEGNLVAKNCTFTVANQQVLVRPPVKNPYWHGKKPFVSGAPVVVPFSVYDKSFLSDGIEVQKGETEFVNLILDAAKLAVSPPMTLDVEQAFDVNDYKDGIYPGKVIKVRGSWSQGQQPLNTARLNQIDPMSTSVLSILDREAQRATGINDLMQGVMPSRRSTATEGALRMQESNSLFDTYARNLEEQLIGDLVEQVWALDLQYYDWSDPCVEHVMGPEFAAILRNMTPEERYRLIEHFEFRGEGLSVVLSKDQELQKIDMLLSRFGRYPVLAQRVNIDYLIEKAVEAMGWNPQKALLPPGQMTPIPGKQEIPQAALPPQAQQMMAQGAPPQGGAPQLPPQIAAMLGGGM